MNCKIFHPIRIFVYCTQWTIDGQFRKFFSASTDCVARIFCGNLQGRRRSSWRRLSLSPPLPPRYSSRVRCKRDSGQGRGREKFSAGSWNVVRTDVTRTANYLRMFQLGRVGRFVPICIIIARNIFKTGIKSLFGIEEKQSRWKFFRINAKFRVKLNWKIPFFFCYFFILKKRTNIFF